MSDPKPVVVCRAYCGDVLSLLDEACSYVEQRPYLLQNARFCAFVAALDEAYGAVCIARSALGKDPE